MSDHDPQHGHDDQQQQPVEHQPARLPLPLPFTLYAPAPTDDAPEAAPSTPPDVSEAQEE